MALACEICGKKPQLWKYDQPRAQRHAAPLESESAARQGGDQGRAQASARLHRLHSRRPRKEGRLKSASDAEGPPVEADNAGSRSGRGCARSVLVQDEIPRRVRTSGPW